MKLENTDMSMGILSPKPLKRGDQVIVKLEAGHIDVVEKVLVDNVWFNGTVRDDYGHTMVILVSEYKVIIDKNSFKTKGSKHWMGTVIRKVAK